MTRKPAGGRRPDSGFTLVETMVSVALFSIVMALVTGVAIEMLKANAGTRDRIANLSQVRTGMDAMSKSIRTAVRPEQLNPACVVPCAAAITAADDYSLAFHANLGEVDAAGNPAPTWVRYVIAADPDDESGATALLTETRRQVLPTWTAGSYPFAGDCTVGGPAVPGCTARMLAAGLQWPFPVEDAPAFAYEGAGGLVLPGTGPLPDPARRAITTVTISLPVGDADNPSAGATSTVFLPNSSLGR